MNKSLAVVCQFGVFFTFPIQKRQLSFCSKSTWKTLFVERVVAVVSWLPSLAKGERNYLLGVALFNAFERSIRWCTVRKRQAEAGFPSVYFVWVMARNTASEVAGIERETSLRPEVNPAIACSKAVRTPIASIKGGSPTALLP